MPRAVVFAFACALGLVTSGCKTSCRLLSEKQCDCTSNSQERTACLTRASQQESTFPPTADDDVRCEALIAGCDCRLVDTQAGKERCGFSSP